MPPFVVPGPSARWWIVVAPALLVMCAPLGGEERGEAVLPGAPPFPAALQTELAVAREAKGPDYLDDYAFVIAGLLDLYETTGEPRWLREAIELDAVLARSFEDPEGGGYFLVKGKLAQRGQPTAYVCERQVCKRPTTDPAVFARQIRASPAVP